MEGREVAPDGTDINDGTKEGTDKNDGNIGWPEEGGTILICSSMSLASAFPISMMVSALLFPISMMVSALL
jgi:hypothetical protein